MCGSAGWNAIGKTSSLGLTFFLPFAASVRMEESVSFGVGQHLSVPPGSHGAPRAAQFHTHFVPWNTGTIGTTAERRRNNGAGTTGWDRDDLETGTALQIFPAVEREFRLLPAK